MKKIFIFWLGLITTACVLFFSDRAIRRIENLDELVAKGQTGFSWIDELLPKYAAVRAEFKKITEALTEAKTLEQRMAAHYAIIRFESKYGRPNSGRAQESLKAIVREGKDSPDTIIAWRQLLEIAQAERNGEEADQLLQNYIAAIFKMSLDKDKLTYLLGAWKTATDLRRSDLELQILEKICGEFPLEVKSLAAHEALAMKCRFSGKTEQLKDLEDKIDKIRSLILKRSEEMTTSQNLREYLQKKEATKAKEALFSMSPGIHPNIDYYRLYNQVITLFEASGNKEEAGRVLLNAVEIFPSMLWKDNQEASFRTAAALVCLENGQYPEAKIHLEKAPISNDSKSWRKYGLARIWVIDQVESPPVVTAEAKYISSLSSLEIEKLDQTGNFPWVAATSVSTNASITLPKVQWRAAYDGNRMDVQVDCTESGQMMVQDNKPNESVWGKDVIEILICPIRSAETYFLFMTNPKETMTHSQFIRSSILFPVKYKKTPQSSSLNAKAVAARRENGWRVTVEIPLQQLNVQVTDKVVAFNVRYGRLVSGKKREYVSWSEEGALSQNPSSTGLLFFK